MFGVFQNPLMGYIDLTPDPPDPPAPTSGIVDRGFIAGLMRGVMFGVGGYVFIEGNTDDMVFIATQTASNSTTIDFVNGSGGVVFDSTYKAYVVVISSLVPATDNTDLWLRTSSNAGSSYDSTASDYCWGAASQNSSGTLTSSLGSTTATRIEIAQAIGNASDEQYSGVVYIFNPADARACCSTYSGIRVNGGSTASYFGQGARNTAQDVDAIRFLMSSGNITSGIFTLYGLANS